MLGQIERALRTLRLQIEAILQDGLHALVAHGAVPQGAHAGRLQSCEAILLPQRQHAQATTIGLLGMAPLAQQPFDQHRAARSHSDGPRGQSVRVAAGHFAVRQRHVRRYRRVTALEGA